MPTQWLNHQSPRLLQAMAMLAAAIGMGLWSALLFAPKPADPPALLALGPVPGQSTEAIANWFGGGNAHLRITVVGLIAAGQRGAALLSINGQPPQAFKVGQTLAQGVTLAAVLPEAIAIDQDGVVQNIPMPGQALPAQGFIPVAR